MAIKHSGSGLNGVYGRVNSYGVAAGHAGKLAIGDFVALTGTANATTGVAEVDIGVAGSPLLGQIAGFVPDFSTENFTDAGGPLTAMALAGHLAQYAGIGGKIEWDVEQMQCINRPEMNTFVRRDYRAGWEV